MVNDINGVNPSITNNTSKKGVEVSNASAETKQPFMAAEQASSDLFEPSAQAKMLSEVEAKIMELPEIDQEKVDKITDSINNGQYKIDSFSLAQHIMEFELA